MTLQPSPDAVDVPPGSFKVRVAYIVGNLVNFDVTPIHIFHRLQSLKGILIAPRVFALLEWTFASSRNSRSKVLSRFTEIGVIVRFYPRIPVLSACMISLEVLIGGYDVVHAIGYNAMLAGTIVKFITRKHLIFESHGAVPEEMVLRGLWRENGWRYRIAKFFERIFVSYCDQMIVVSNSYREFVKGLYKKKNIWVAGCAVSLASAAPIEKRLIARNRLNVGSRLVIGFNGSFFAEWGDPSEYIEIFDVIRGLGFHPVMLVLSQSPASQIEAYLNKAAMNEADYRIFNLPHEDVPNVLVSADVGLLLRRDSIVNQVASPMKFPEYLLSGVPVIASDKIGDVSDLIRTHGLGFIYRRGDPTVADKLRIWLTSVQSEEENDLRLRCREFAQRNLSYSAQTDLYRKIYSSVRLEHG